MARLVAERRPRNSPENFCVALAGPPRVEAPDELEIGEGEQAPRTSSRTAMMGVQQRVGDVAKHLPNGGRAVMGRGRSYDREDGTVCRPASQAVMANETATPRQIFGGR